MLQEEHQTSLPIIDFAPYFNQEDTKQTAQQIRRELSRVGFLYIKNHGIPEELQDSILENSKKFFNLPAEEKMEIHMSKSGRAFRGYVTLGG